MRLLCVFCNRRACCWFVKVCVFNQKARFVVLYYIFGLLCCFKSIFGENKWHFSSFDAHILIHMIQSISNFSMENRTSDANIYYELIFQNVSLLSLWCFVCPCIFSRCFISFTLCCSFAPYRDSRPKFPSLKLHLADKNQHKELKTHKNPQNIHWKLNMHTSRASILCLLPSLPHTRPFFRSFLLFHIRFLLLSLTYILLFFLLPLSHTHTRFVSPYLTSSSSRTLSIPLCLILKYSSLKNIQAL